MTDRDQYVAGLRALADVLEANPDVKLPYHGVGGTISWYPYGDEANQRATAATIVRALPVKVDKAPLGDSASPLFEFNATLGGPDGLRVSVVVNRDAVCERVVVGTKTETKWEKDPDQLAEIPEVKVTREVEVVEWRCGSLLAPTPEPVS